MALSFQRKGLSKGLLLAALLSGRQGRVGSCRMENSPQTSGTWASPGAWGSPAQGTGLTQHSQSKPEQLRKSPTNPLPRRPWSHRHHWWSHSRAFSWPQLAHPTKARYGSGPRRTKPLPEESFGHRAEWNRHSPYTLCCLWSFS